jgi:polysaccharide biosynthesis/export protein
LTKFRRKKIVSVFFRFFSLMNSRPLPLLLGFVLAIGLPLRGEKAADKNVARSDELRMETVAKADYILQPGDVLRVQVTREEDINKSGEVRVSQENTVTLPYIGAVDLKGKTVRQAEGLIRQLYDRDYLVNPQVNVTVVKYAERNVQVFGAVNTPGIVNFPPEEGLTLSAAISHAGGFSRLANKKDVTLTRTGPDGKPINQTINCDNLLKGGGSENVPLQPDDIINVPERIL